MSTGQSRNCSDVHHHGGDYVLACAFSYPPPPPTFLALNASISDLFFFFACSAFIPLSLSPLHPSDLDYTFLQLPELNNALPHISMQPDQKTKIPLRPLLSVSVTLSPSIFLLASAHHVPLPHQLSGLHICCLLSIYKASHLSYPFLLLSQCCSISLFSLL